MLHDGPMEVGTAEVQPEVPASHHHAAIRRRR
jgi:hypothetical protein